MISNSLLHKVIPRPAVNRVWIVLSSILASTFSHAGNPNNELSGHYNPFTEALEKTTTANELRFNLNNMNSNTNHLPLFMPKKKDLTSNQKKSNIPLSYEQISTINALLATGEFVSADSEPLIYIHGEDKKNDYKTGSSAMNQLLKMSLKSWFKNNKYENNFLSQLTKSEKIQLNNPTFKTKQHKDWDYSVKLTGQKIKVQLGKEL